MTTSETKDNDLFMLVTQWKIRLNKAQIGHYIATERFTYVHYCLGIPLVVLSTFVSTVLFLDISNQSSLLTILVIVSSILTTVLASLQTFLKPSEQAELHRTKAAKYGALKRDMELFLAKNVTKSEVEKFLSESRREWDYIASDAPVTPRGIRKKVSDLLKDELQEHKHLANTET